MQRVSESLLMLDCDLQQRIIRFVAAETGLDPAQITSTTRLLQDLGIDGDDAAELLTSFSEVFEVDMTGLNFGASFRGEPTIVNIWRPTPPSQLHPITIADLINAASRRRWLPD